MGCSRLRRESDQLASLKNRLKNLSVNAASLRKAKMKTLMLKQKLEALDPHGVLRRGFSVVRQSDGEIIRDSNQLNEGQELTIQLPQGTIKVKITEILS
jgi:exodeoxyribonuclease VII large subunit